MGTGSAHQDAEETQSCSKVAANGDSFPQQGSQAPPGERRKPWSGAGFSQADWEGPGTEPATFPALSESSSRPSEEPGAGELSQRCLFPVMIYLIKLCLKISLAGGLFSAGPG